MLLITQLHCFLETAFFNRLGHDFLLIYYLILRHIERGRQNTAGGDNMRGLLQDKADSVQSVCHCVMDCGSPDSLD